LGCDPVWLDEVAPEGRAVPNRVPLNAATFWGMPTAVCAPAPALLAWWWTVWNVSPAK
jgi:hypothetical protein